MNMFGRKEKRRKIIRKNYVVKKVSSSFESDTTDKTIVTSSNQDSTEKRLRGDGCNTGSGWEGLPSDLMLKIQENLNIFDKTRVHCVCKSWQSLMPKANISQPVPFLFLPPQLDRGCCRFYDTVDNRSYNLNRLFLSRGEELVFRGSSYGWLVAVIESGPQICLINPLTGSREQLPDVAWNGVKVTDKYILSSNPSSSDDYVVVAIYGKYSRLAYTRHGDDTWTSIERNRSFIDIAFYEGELYGLTKKLELMHIKIFSGGSRVTRIGPLVDSVPRRSFHNYLVGSSIGLLRVERTTDEGPLEEAQDHKRSMRDYSTEFRVYKFDFELDRWSDSLADIGENVLFVGRICSMSVPSRNCPKGCSNSMYFMDNCVVPNPLFPRGCLHVGVFDLKTRIVEHSVATLRFGLQYFWPWSIWVSPSI